MDQQTILQDNLQFGCIKILLDDSWQLPSKIPLWLDDLSILVVVEEKLEDPAVELERNLGCWFCGKIVPISTMEDDDEVTSKFSNFKCPSAHEFELMFEGRSSLADPTEAHTSDLLLAQSLDLTDAYKSGCVLGQREDLDCFSGPN